MVVTLMCVGGAWIYLHKLHLKHDTALQLSEAQGYAPGFANPAFDLRRGSVASRSSRRQSMDSFSGFRAGMGPGGDNGYAAYAPDGYDIDTMRISNHQAVPEHEPAYASAHTPDGLVRADSARRLSATLAAANGQLAAGGPQPMPRRGSQGRSLMDSSSA